MAHQLTALTVNRILCEAYRLVFLFAMPIEPYTRHEIHNYYIVIMSPFGTEFGLVIEELEANQLCVDDCLE